MKTKSRLKKMNFLLEEEVQKELQSLVPSGKRSKMVNEAVKKELLQLKRKTVTTKLLRLRRVGPKVSMKEIVKSLKVDRESH